MTGLADLARLNNHWFKLDESLRPEMYTFHMSFGKCTIMPQDVVYQLGLPINKQYVNRCLTDLERYIEGG
ncbi:hypothetical protein Ahy_A09g041499 [Arachis hypogaea]|uniref:Aminotransferase-like plant mobile domain-containing protein n=1 Tax=Arachis hypogaea TaxID=3818 RepID=A0A445BCX6_ARAHY|nr:hypothetical protein Ahy_A09g041499 [Arachis hypogaea]